MENITMREMAIVLVVNLDQVCARIEGKSVFKNQLLRAASSIGANISEARYAQSNADFVSKLEIALKEAYETEYWLEVLYRVNALGKETYHTLLNACGRIRRKLIASITTIKNKNTR